LILKYFECIKNEIEFLFQTAFTVKNQPKQKILKIEFGLKGLKDLLKIPIVFEKF
jgi:hypothetical protein